MNAKPIRPLLHGIIDYTFSAALLVVPHLLKLNKKAVRLYTFNGVNTALYCAITGYPLGIKHYIPYKLHRKIDIDTIGLLALTTLYKPIRKDKRAVAFNISMIVAGIVTVLLTDWDADAS